MLEFRPGSSEMAEYRQELCYSTECLKSTNFQWFFKIWHVLGNICYSGLLMERTCAMLNFRNGNFVASDLGNYLNWLPLDLKAMSV